MYQSTPQHVIDEESHPGVLAEMLESSSSSGSSSSSSGSDSDGSSGSRTTAKRIKRVLRRRRRRKSSASSKDTPSLPSTVGTPSASNFSQISNDLTSLESRGEQRLLTGQTLGAILDRDEADTDAEHDRRSTRIRATTVNFRDFEKEREMKKSKPLEAKMMKESSKSKHRKLGNPNENQMQLSEKIATEHIPKMDNNVAHEPRVGSSQNAPTASDNAAKRAPFTLRGISMARPPLPAMPRMLSTTVFSAANPTGPSYNGPQGLGITPRALHRSNSLPSRLNQAHLIPTATAAPSMPGNASHPSLVLKDGSKVKKHMSRTAAIILLLVSTALVAVCAEFLVSSIGYLVGHTSVSEAFIGLIVLPIVGNAAEHVTAVTVASKNKMDLAIGVAVGSSIQIALFVTPVIVLLGWILQKDMSLYFSLFETVSLFVTVFVVNFLVLDGRSNYLEGALLIAVYVIIALAAFFYPNSDQQSQVGGGQATMKMLKLM